MVFITNIKNQKLRAAESISHIVQTVISLPGPFFAQVFSDKFACKNPLYECMIKTFWGFAFAVNTTFCLDMF